MAIHQLDSAMSPMRIAGRRNDDFKRCHDQALRAADTDYHPEDHVAKDLVLNHVVPLEKFYASLSDEQKAQFDAMKVEPEPQATRSASGNRRTVVSSMQVCRAQTLDYSAAFPEQAIEKSIQPTDAQKAALDELRAVATRGPDLLKDTCPTEMPSTPTGRLAAVQARLDAMLAAVRTERPAMDKFYSSLSDEQKARFNALRPPQQPNRHRG